MAQVADAEQETQPAAEKLLATDQAWAAAVASGNKEQIPSYWTDDAINCFPGQPPAIGKQAIRRLVRNNRSRPGPSLTWRATNASVARSNDIGHTHGSFRMSVPGPDGESVTKRGYSIFSDQVRTVEGAFSVVLTGGQQRYHEGRFGFGSYTSSLLGETNMLRVACALMIAGLGAAWVGCTAESEPTQTSQSETTSPGTASTGTVLVRLSVPNMT